MRIEGLTTQNVGRRLRAIRVDRGLEQSELAEKVGLSISAINRYERGQTVMNFINAAKLCKALDWI